MAEQKWLDKDGVLYLWAKVKELVSANKITKTSELVNDSKFVTADNMPKVDTPDYEQNDSTAADYIKNRPFYEDEGVVFENDFAATGGAPYAYWSPSGESNTKVSSSQSGYDLVMNESAAMFLTYNGDTTQPTLENVNRFTTIEENGQSLYVSNIDTNTEPWHGSTIEQVLYANIVNKNNPAIVIPVGTKNIYITLASEAGNRTSPNRGFMLSKLTMRPKIKKIDEKFLPDSALNDIGKSTITGGEIFNDYDSNRAEGEASHAEGKETAAQGIAAHAEGYKTKAYKNYSHAEGDSTTASGISSHAEGYGSIAQGYAAHAEGYCKSTGDYAHAEGRSTTAQGNNSHAEGYETCANGENQHVEGRCNVTDENLAHIVGNGDVMRSSNAYTLDWSGNAWFAGDVYVGSKSGINKDAGSKKLITEADVTAKGYQTAAQVTAAVSKAVEGITGFSYKVVEALPETGEAGVIYMIKHEHADGDQYDEYFWTGDGYEKLGHNDLVIDAISNDDINEICK